MWVRLHFRRLIRDILESMKLRILAVLRWINIGDYEECLIKKNQNNWLLSNKLAINNVYSLFWLINVYSIGVIIPNFKSIGQTKAIYPLYTNIPIYIQ